MTEIVPLEPLDGSHWIDEPRPGLSREFVERIEATGWKVGLLWRHEWTDPEDGTVYPGGWDTVIVKEEFADDHDPWWFCMSFALERLDYPEAWSAFMRLAEMAWEDFCDKQRYPRCDVPFNLYAADEE